MNSSKRSLRDYDSLPDRIKQHRQADKRGVLVVEGPSDKRLISRVSNSSWAVFIAGNRTQVISTVTATQELKVSRTAGLVDRDFDEAVEIAQDQGLPIYTFDQADLEAALVILPVFDVMIEEFGSIQKIEAAGGTDNLRKTAIGIAAIVGCVRRESMSRNWGINFDELDFTKKIDARSLVMSLPKFVNSILPRLRSPEEKNYLKEIARGFDPAMTPDGVLFRGRDALHVVRIALQRVYGNSSISDTEDIARSLRLAATTDFLDAAPFPALIAALEISGATGEN